MELLEKIDSELKDFRKETNHKLDNLNEKVISAQKDIEHIQTHFDDKIKASGKNIKEIKDSFKTFRDEIKVNIIDEVKKTSQSLRLRITISALSVTTTFVLLLINKFL
jgi:hypothetical protein